MVRKACKVGKFMIIFLGMGLLAVYSHRHLSQTLTEAVFVLSNLLMGGVLAWFCLSRDAERMATLQTINLLQENIGFSNKNQLDAYFLNTLRATITWDAQFRIQSCNPMALEIFGFSEEEFLGSHASIIVPERNRKDIGRYWEEVLKKFSFHSELKNVTKDGRIIYCEWFNVPQFDVQGNVVAVYSIVNDVTRIKVAENEKRAIQGKLDNILASIQDFVYIIELDGTISFANQAAYDAMGIKDYQDRRIDIREIISPAEVELALSRIMLAVKTNQIQPLQIYNLQVVASERIVIPVEVRAVPFVEDGIRKVLGVARPIEDRLLLEKERIKIDRMQSIGVLAGGIAHDFNNLLTGILGYAGLIKGGLVNAELRDDYLGKIINASERATGLTHQLLTFSKGGASVIKIDSLARAIREATEFALGSYERCNCQYHIPDDLWLCLMDFAQISQVIQNLVINANHAMPEGGTIFIDAKNIQLENGNSFGLKGSDYVHVQVTDSGIGIPEKLMAKIFDPYFTTKGLSGEGSGLGLAVAYAIIQKHAGHIWAESEVGKGSKFHIYLPSANSEVIENETRATLAKTINPLKILLIEDGQENRELFVRMLDSLGHTSFPCENAEAGLEVFLREKESEKPIDLVITDLTLPGGGMDGVALTQRIRQESPSTKVIGISGYAENVHRLRFDDFISKPFGINQLRQAIEKMS